MKFDARVRNIVADRLAVDHVIFGVSAHGIRQMVDKAAYTFDDMPPADDLIDQLLDYSILTYGHEYYAWFAVPAHPIPDGTLESGQISVKAPSILRAVAGHICIVTKHRDFSNTVLPGGRILTAEDGETRAYSVLSDIALSKEVMPFSGELNNVFINFPKDNHGETRWRQGEHGIFLKEWHDEV